MKILPLLRNHHLLLVTLLLANAAAMEALPLFLDKVTCSILKETLCSSACFFAFLSIEQPALPQLMSPIAAICTAVTFVLFFGEVIPQALCTRCPPLNLLSHFWDSVPCPARAPPRSSIHFLDYPFRPILSLALHSALRSLPSRPGTRIIATTIPTRTGVSITTDTRT